MSIIISNVSKHDDLAGVNDYELRINSTVLLGFKHERRQGLASCLRAAADAYEADPPDDWKAPEAIPPNPEPEDMKVSETGIYIASKTKHADRWRALRASGVPINSTWIDEAGVGES